MGYPTGLVTAEELERMPRDDQRHELVNGRLIHMSPVGALHGVITVRMLVLLSQHVRTHRLGFVLTEVGFKLTTNPDTVRGPDVAFVRQDRLTSDEIPRGFWSGPPDFVVEVLSPDDRPLEITAKIKEYVTSGVQCVWIVDPDKHAVTVHRGLHPPVTFTGNDRIDTADAVPGFSCLVSEIFE